jgi:hypothetical protein
MTIKCKGDKSQEVNGCVQHKHQITFHKCALVETSEYNGRCTQNSTLAIYAKFEFKYLNCDLGGGGGGGGFLKIRKNKILKKKKKNI